MKEEIISSNSNLNNNNNELNHIKFYNINTLNRKNTFKISEKDCSDINSIVRNSVEKINDLLNSQEFNNNPKKSQTIKKEKENEKPMKTNFTFNINNFINVPNKNESMNIINKKDRYDDFVDDFWLDNENNKIKTNQKRQNNNKIKNRNINYSTNIHNSHNSNEKNMRNSIRKKKLFEEGINMQYSNNFKKNINFSNFKGGHNKIKKKTENEKDKSITVNTKYKKYNTGEVNSNNLNKAKENQINSENIKYSISDDIKTNKKFTPNIININSLSDHRNIKNFIFNNNNINKKEKKNSKIKKQNNNGGKKYIYKSPKNNKNNKNIKSPHFQDDCKTLLFTEEKNLNNLNKNLSNTNILAKSLSNNNTEKINIIQIDNNIYKDFSRSTVNKKLKKENTYLTMKKKCGYSCDHRNNNNYYTNNQNMHKILNKIYYKDFPNKIKTNTIMKLFLFLNEYLISNNLLDDYYDINNQNKLDSLSKFFSSKFFVDFPQQDDVNFDQMINAIKKIQRMWRKTRMKKFLEKNNKKEENELKKMVLNKYIKKAGFKIKKIIGLFNSMVECFDLIDNEKEIEEMFYNIQQIIKRKLTPYEKNILYKDYINNIIFDN